LPLEEPERAFEWLIPTWSSSLSYKPNEDHHFYANWSRGYKAGGVNLRPLHGNLYLNRYDPELTDAAELGLKSVLLSGLAKVNVAIYKNWYHNVQDFSYYVLGDNLLSRFENRANAASYGFEVDF